MSNIDDARERVMTGETWSAFCDSLKAAGEVILRPEAPASELDRAEGWRYLSRLTRLGLEMMLEFADPDFPVFYAASHQTVKVGSDNPDNTYWNATVAGDRRYRITGTRGEAPLFTIGTKANRLAIDGTMASTGELDGRTMAIGPDGRFEVIVSQERPSTEKPGTNWLPMAADTNFVIVRETFFDRKNEIPARLKIECIDGASRPAQLTAARVDRSLAAASAFVRGTAKTFADWAQIFKERPNELPKVDQSMFQRTGGDPTIYYIHGYWQLDRDEALVVESEVPHCRYWNIVINNYWDESLDYRYLPIHLNNHTAKRNADGTVTVVIAAENPGVPNFLDTDGHTSGIVLLRWVAADRHPQPRCRVVKLSELQRR